MVSFMGCVILRLTRQTLDGFGHDGLHQLCECTGGRSGDHYQAATVAGAGSGTQLVQ